MKHEGANDGLLNAIARSAIWAAIGGTEDHGPGQIVAVGSSASASLAVWPWFAVCSCRVIIDPVDRALPPAALIDLRPDGTPDVPRVLRSVLRNPCQVPALLRVAANAHAAHLALRAGRQHLGDGLRFPEFR